MSDKSIEKKPYDWNSFTRKKKINASMAAIYNAWTSQKDIETWFLKTAKFKAPDGTVRMPDEDIQAGDAWEWTWFGWDGKDQGKVLEVNGKNLIKFTFAEDCVVTVTIIPDGNGHMVQLVQNNIPLDDDSKAQKHLGCSVGWTMYLMNLKSVLEGGLDLRTKDDTAS